MPLDDCTRATAGEAIADIVHSKQDIASQFIIIKLTDIYQHTPANQVLS